MGRVIKDIYADVVVMYKDKYIKMVITSGFFFLGFVLFYSSTIIDEGVSYGYFTKQLMISLALYLPIVFILIGTYLGGKDYEWGTDALRFVNDTKMRVHIGRIMILFVVSMLFTGVCYAVGTIYDFISGKQRIIKFDLMYEYVMVLFIVLFWGILSYVFSMLIKNYITAAVVACSYFTFETLMANIIPEDIIKWLPAWNIRNILMEFFNDREGLFIVWQIGKGEFFDSLIKLIIIFLVIILIGIFCNINYRNNKSKL